ncbi:hypothetical protein [Pedobacter sp. ASV28]|uniref:hypothetical protein n=1 Tax=Pedobacter sp. ASV28 TaxID=2795123 RepID=UPI0018ED5EB9|nr:hypothetical protein [Pedobacter sp. ASV28]
MNGQSLTLLVAFGGIVLGWILTQGANWYKGRKEDNRVRNETIFQLLEISYVLRKAIDINSKDLMELFVEFSKNNPELNMGDPPPEMESILNNSVIPMLKEHFYNELKDINDDYEQAVKSLAPVDPIIAYSLRGKASIVGQFDQLVKNFSAELFEKHLPAEQHNSADAILKTIVESSTYVTAITEIESLTIDLAEKVGFITKWKVKKILTNDKQKKEERKAEILKIVDLMTISLKQGIVLTNQLVILNRI